MRSRRLRTLTAPLLPFMVPRAALPGGFMDVFVAGRNLTDRLYVAAVVVKDQADAGMVLLHPGAPRSFHVGARYRI